MKANHPINIQTLAPSFLLPHQESLTNTASDQAVIKTPVCFKFTLSQNVFVSCVESFESAIRTEGEAHRVSTALTNPPG